MAMCQSVVKSWKEDGESEVDMYELPCGVRSATPLSMRDDVDCPVDITGVQKNITLIAIEMHHTLNKQGSDH